MENFAKVFLTEFYTPLSIQEKWRGGAIGAAATFYTSLSIQEKWRGGDIGAAATFCIHDKCVELNYLAQVFFILDILPDFPCVI